MDYFLTEEQLMVQELARQVAEEKVLPVRAELDEKEEFPREVLKHFAEADLFGIHIPEEYGGMGMGGFEHVLAVEQVSRVCAGTAVSYAASQLGCTPLLLYGSEELKKKYLPSIASGEKLAAFALTESQAGSDAGAIQTRAEKDGDEYVLTGTKQWITNAGEADIYTVIAMTDPSRGPRGASFFVVEKGDPGFDFGKKEKKLGIRCSATGELVFNKCRIPADRLIGREGLGFIIAMKTFDTSRPGVGAPGSGHRPGRFGRSGQVRPHAPPVRPAGHQFPGRPAHAGRHGHPGRGIPGPGLCRGPVHRQPEPRMFPRFRPWPNSFRRTRPCA